MNLTVVLQISKILALSGSLPHTPAGKNLSVHGRFLDRNGRLGRATRKPLVIDKYSVLNMNRQMVLLR